MKRSRVGLVLVVVVALSLVTAEAGARVGPPVKIGGPNKLKAVKVLSFPVFVSADSFVKVRGALRLPGPNLPVNLSGQINQGRPKEVRLTLNGSAKADLQAAYKASSLKIIVTARNLLTNIKHTARKTFGFKKP